MSTGNVMGKLVVPATTAASGIWSLREHYLAANGSTWPTPFFYNTTNLVLYYDAAKTASYPGSGSTWYDLSGAGNHGTLINSPTYSAGAITFNGSNQYVNAAVTKTANCTFSCWAKSTAALSQPMLFIAGPNGSGPDLFFYSGVIAWNTWDGASASFGSIPATANNGAWHHYAVVTDTSANNTKLYYDGSLLGSTTYKSAAGSTDLRIGGTTDTYMWNGSIGLFTVNNTALTAADVLSNYNGQKARFS